VIHYVTDDAKLVKTSESSERSVSAYITDVELTMTQTQWILQLFSVNTDGKLPLSLSPLPRLI